MRQLSAGYGSFGSLMNTVCVDTRGRPFDEVLLGNISADVDAHISADVDAQAKTKAARLVLDETRVSNVKDTAVRVFDARPDEGYPELTLEAETSTESTHPNPTVEPHRLVFAEPHTTNVFPCRSLVYHVYTYLS